MSDNPTEILFPYRPSHVPRTVDLLKLFDTTADLSGGDIDIADWVRGGDELDVYVFWRDQKKDETPSKKLKPRHEELCPVGIGSFKEHWHDLKKHDAAQIWRQVYNKGWEPLAEDDLIYPGQVFLLNTPCGGYSTREGWKPDDPNEVKPVEGSPTSASAEPTGNEQGDEDSPEGQWQSIFTHSQKVWTMLVEEILHDPTIKAALEEPERGALYHTPPWHDYGKAHEKFLAKLTAESRTAWEGLSSPTKETDDHPAKAPKTTEKERESGQKFPWKSNFDYAEDFQEIKDFKDGKIKEEDVLCRRPGFRHELASALGLLELIKLADSKHDAVSLPGDQMKELKKAAPHAFEDSNQNDHASVPGLPAISDLAKADSFTLDLLLYLIASHHGKVRMGLSSTDADHETDPKKNPDPLDPADPQRRIRGVQDGDTLPACRLPAASSGKNSFTTPEITLDLSPSELFSARYGRSWRERTSGLLAVLGPFRLAYLEALIRAADGRGSAQ